MNDAQFLRRLRRWVLSGAILASTAPVFGAATPAMAQAGASPVPAGRCAVIVASRQSLSQARTYIQQSIPDPRSVQVFRSANGWFAISIGTLTVGERPAAMARMVAEGRIPSDAFCSTGERLLEEVRWRTGAAPPPTTSAVRRPAYMGAAFRPGPAQTCAANGDTSNLRTGPGTSHPIVAALMNGTRVEVLREFPETSRTSWYLVRYAHAGDAALSVTGHISGILLTSACQVPHSRAVAGTTGSVIRGREVNTLAGTGARPQPQPQPQPTPQPLAQTRRILGVPGMASERAAEVFHGRIGLIESIFTARDRVVSCAAVAVADRIILTAAHCLTWAADQGLASPDVSLGFAETTVANRIEFHQAMTVEGRARQAVWVARTVYLTQEYLDGSNDPGHLLAIVMLAPGPNIERLQQTFGTSGYSSGANPDAHATFVAGISRGVEVANLNPARTRLEAIRPVQDCRQVGDARPRSWTMRCGGINVLAGSPFFSRQPQGGTDQNYVSGIVVGRNPSTETLSIARLTVGAHRWINWLNRGQGNPAEIGEAWVRAEPGQTLYGY